MNIKIITVVIGAFFGLSGCASNHHLVFFTNTTIGLEVSSDPTGGSPAKFILGYKRQEGVIDPLIPEYEYIPADNGSMTEPENGDTNIVMTPKGTAIPKGSVTKSHSVLAKMNFGATGGGTGASAAQFFATGRAAELIAMAPGISGALSGDPGNNIIKSLASSDSSDTAVFAYLDDIYRMLNKATKNGNNIDRAKEIKTKVDAIDDGAFKIVYKNYTWVSAAKSNLNINDYDIKNGISEFPNVYQYLSTLSNSRKVAKEAIIKDGVIASASGAVLSDAEKLQMVNDIESFLASYEDGKELVSSNKDVLEMIDFVHKNVVLTKTEKK